MMVSNSIPDNEQERLKALQEYTLLDTLDEKEFDRFTRLASIICQCPIALISLIDDKRQWFKSRVGVEVTETPREIAICRYSILGMEILEVEDVSKDLRFKDDIIVNEGEDLLFYAGKPLIDPNGFALGTLCVLDTKPKKLSMEQKEALKILGDQVMALIVERSKKPVYRYFENAFRLSDELICIIGPDGILKKINPAFIKILGYDEQFLLSTSIFDLLPPEDLAVARERFKKITKGKQNIKFTQCLNAKNGECIYLAWETTLEPMTGNIFAIGRNVTKEREKEKLLKLSEKKFRSFFENSQGLMFTHDLEGKLLSINAFGAKLLGFSSKKMIGINLSQFIPNNFHPDISTYLKEIKSKGKAKGLFTTVQKNGQDKKVWLFNNSLERDLEGNEYVIGNSIDITERLKLERDVQGTKELLHQTNQMARIGGWKLDLVKDEITWTDVTRSIHEVDEDFIPYKKATEAFFKEGYYRNKIRKTFENAIINGEAWNEKFKIITGKGREIWVRVIGKPVFEDNQCIQVHGTFHDIDNQTKNEQELKRKEQMLFAISKATDELLSNNDLYDATSKSLKLIGKAVATDRIYFFENGADEANNPVTPLRYEGKGGMEPKINHPDLQNIPFGVLEDFIPILKQKKTVHIVASQIAGRL
ncbi:MAG: PAS domain S-box protein [Anditalea sp.]